MKNLVITIPIDGNLDICLSRLGQRLFYNNEPIANAAHEGRYSEHIIVWSEDNWAGDAFKAEIVDKQELALSPEECKMIRDMVDIHMKRNLMTFTLAECDAGWKFISMIDCLESSPKLRDPNDRGFQVPALEVMG